MKGLVFSCILALVVFLSYCKIKSEKLKEENIYNPSKHFLLTPISDNSAEVYADYFTNYTASRIEAKEKEKMDHEMFILKNRVKAQEKEIKQQKVKNSNSSSGSGISNDVIYWGAN